MTKMRHLALLCAVVIIGLLIPPAMAVEPAPGEHIYYSLGGAQDRPDIDGNMIVWEDGRNGNKDIYFATVDEFRGEQYRGKYQYLSYTGRQITDDPASQEKPSISGDYIVWQDNRNGDWDIYLYKLSTDEAIPLTKGETGNQWMPIVRGNYVAWYDDSNGKTNIVLYDIAAGSVKETIKCNAQTKIQGDSGTEFKPALSEKYVAWVERGEDRIKYYEIGTGKIGYVSTKTVDPLWPSLYGSHIAWEDYRNGEPDIYMLDLDDPSSGEQQITADPHDQVSPAISGSIIAWEDIRDGPRNIYIYDRSRKVEMHVVVPDYINEGQLYPAVSGNTIVWQSGWTPYSDLYVFVYDPSAPVEPILESITVTPSSATTEINGKVEFAATCYDQFGNTMTGVEVTWTSSNEAVGTIDRKTGVFTARAAGTADVIATAGERTTKVTVTVSAEDPELARIEVKPTTATVAIDRTKKFEATAFDQFDNEMAGVKIAWTSSDEAVGTVDTAGLFTAHAEGTTTLTATAGKITAKATVTVSTEDPALASIEVRPATATVAIDKTKKFEATLLDQFGNEMTGVEVTWTSSDEAVGTVDANGLFTALAAGTTDVIATAGERTAKATVTVSADAQTPVDPVQTSIQVTPPRATLEVGDDQKFIVTAYDQFGNVMPAGEVTWTSSDETIGTIGADGHFTALAEGTVTITAETGGDSAQATITVNAAGPTFGMVVISPSAVSLDAGDTWQFDVIAFDRFGNIVPDVEVTWEVSDPCVGTIDDCGVFTALAAGTTTICAVGDGAAGTATVTVTCDESALTRIAVTPSAITLATGDEETLTATAYDQDGCEISDVEVTWASSDDAIGTIDADGRFTALAEGTATITASAEGVTGTAEVAVTSAPSGLIDAVTVSPPAITLDVGETWQFTATAYDLDGNVTPDTVVTWSCDDETSGTINDNGVFEAMVAGTTTLTASVDGINEVGTAEVTVRSTSPVLARIAVSPSDFYIAAGKNLKVTATAFDQYGYEMPDVEVTWEVSDPCVGTIDDCGVFTALEEGEVTLTASADDVSDSACVTVEPSLAVPACIEIEPTTATIAAGDTREFVATVFDQCNNKMDWVRVAWSCSDQEVGTLDRAGLFAAFAEGSADVKALAGGIEGTAAVTVTARPTTDPTPDPTNPGENGGSKRHDWGDGGGDTGPTFSAGIRENLRSGETFTFSDVTVSSVNSVAITAANTIPRLMVTVKEASSPSVAAPPADDIYEYVDISLYWADQRGISSAEIVFTVSADWLRDHRMTPEDVRLMRYVNGAWQSLETEIISEGSGNYRFRAVTPGFSIFAIAAGSENRTATGETNATTGVETNVTTNETGNVTLEMTTTEATTPPATEATTPATPLVYAPFLAPLAFLLWRRKKN